MDLIGTVLLVFLITALVVGCKRTLKVIVKGINWIFDKIESKIGG